MTITTEELIRKHGQIVTGPDDSQRISTEDLMRRHGPVIDEINLDEPSPPTTGQRFRAAAHLAGMSGVPIARGALDLAGTMADVTTRPKPLPLTKDRMIAEQQYADTLRLQRAKRNDGLGFSPSPEQRAAMDAREAVELENFRKQFTPPPSQPNALHRTADSLGEFYRRETADARQTAGPFAFNDPVSWGTGIVEQAPTMAMTILSGGAAGSLAKTAGMGPKAQKIFAVGTAMGSGGAIEGLQAQNEAIDYLKSQKPGQPLTQNDYDIAATVGLSVAGISTALERTPAGMFAGGEGKKQVVRRILHGFMAEGKTEFLQSASNEAIQMIATGNPIDPTAPLAEAFLGGLMGGGFGAATTPGGPALPDPQQPQVSSFLEGGLAQPAPENIEQTLPGAPEITPDIPIEIQQKGGPNVQEIGQTGRQEMLTPVARQETSDAAQAPPLISPAAEPAVPRGGKSTVLELPSPFRGQTQVPVAYEAVELETLLPSHNALAGFAQTPGGDANVRPYHEPVAGRPEREQVTQRARNLKPNLLINTSPTAVDGPPVVAGDNRVLGGNSRTMMLQLAYQGRQGLKYKQQLGAQAAEFGLDPVSVEGMSKPVLIRRVLGDAGGPGEMSKVLNESLTVTSTPAANATARGSQLKQVDIDLIAEQLGDDTLAEAMEKRTGVTVLRTLVSAGAVTQNELADMTEAGRLNPVGKQAVERSLLGSVIDDPGVLAEIPAGVRQKVVKSLPSLVRLRSSEPQRFGGILSDALDIVGLKTALEAESVGDVIEQSMMNPRKSTQNPQAVKLATMFDEKTASEISNTLKKLASKIDDALSGQVPMFGPAPTVDEAFAEVFGPAPTGGAPQIGRAGQSPAQKLTSGAVADKVRSLGGRVVRTPGGAVAGFRGQAVPVSITPVLPPPSGQQVGQLRQSQSQAGQMSRTTPGNQLVTRGLYDPAAGAALSEAEATGETVTHELMEAAVDSAVRSGSIRPAEEKLLRKHFVDQAGMFDRERFVEEATAEAEKRSAKKPPSSRLAKAIRAVWDAMQSLRHRVMPSRGSMVREAAKGGLFGRKQAKSFQSGVVSNIRMWEDESQTMAQKIKQGLLGSGGGFEVTWIDKLKGEVLDAMWPVLKAANLAQARSGKPLLPENDPRILLRLLGGASRKTERMFRSGLVDAELKAVIDPVTKSHLTLEWLLGAFDPASFDALRSQMEDAARLGAAQRTLEKATQVKGAVSGIGQGGALADVAEAQRIVAEISADQARKARSDEALRRYRLWADSTIQYMEDKGYLDAAGAKKIRDHNKFYLNFQRVMEDVGVEGGEGQALPKFEGSERLIDNPYVNLLLTTERQVRAADRNEAWLAFNNLLGASNADIGQKAKEAGRGTVMVRNNGKREHWSYDPDVRRAMEGIEPVDHWVAKLLSAPGQLKRTLVTASPAFMIRNTIRDAATRGVISSEGSKPWDILKGYSDEQLADFEYAGGGNFGHFRSDRATYHKELDKKMRELAGDKSVILMLPKAFAKGWGELGRMSENVGRMAEYRAAYKAATAKRMNDYNAMLYAADKARGLLDFAVAGAAVQHINAIMYMPFLNSKIQGLAATVRAAKARPAQTWWRFVRLVAIPSMAAYAASIAMGPEKEEEYLSMPAWRRDFFWNVGIGDVWITIPKPFELGVLGSGFERAIAAMRGKDNAFEGWAKSAAGQVVIGDDVMMGPLGTLLETMSNHSFFFDRSIVPPWENGLALDLRKTDSASRLGKALQSATEVLGVGVDARKIDHIINSMAGGTGRLATLVSDAGRGDRDPTQYGSALTGLTSTASGYSAPNVQWVLDKSRELGDQKISEPVMEYLRQVKDAPTLGAKADLKRRARLEAARIRKEIEGRDDELIREKQYRREQRIETAGAGSGRRRRL